MKRTVFSLISAFFFLLSFILCFLLIGYKFTGLLLFAAGLYFAFLALSCSARSRHILRLRKIITVLASVGVIFVLILSSIVISGMNGDAARPADYVIILGAGLNGDVPSLTLSERLSRAEEYLKQFPDCVAVVSGGMGSGETTTEAEAMSRYLIARGIDRSRIIKEHNAKNTSENIAFSLKKIKEHGSGDFSVAVISSDYHILRARMIAESFGLSPVMVSAKTSLPVLRINYIFREAFALVKTGITIRR